MFMMFSMLISIYEYYNYNMILGLRDCDYNYSYSRFGGYRLGLLRDWLECECVTMSNVNACKLKLQCECRPDSMLRVLFLL